MATRHQDLLSRPHLHTRQPPDPDPAPSHCDLPLIDTHSTWRRSTPTPPNPIPADPTNPPTMTVERRREERDVKTLRGGREGERKQYRKAEGMYKKEYTTQTEQGCGQAYVCVRACVRGCVFVLVPFNLLCKHTKHDVSKYIFYQSSVHDPQAGKNMHSVTFISICME